MAQVPAEPERIVVLSGDQLDALCALGLQSRVVGAALPDGSSSQPSYLGKTVHGLPGVGTRSSPDLRAIAAARPDLILGSVAVTPNLYSQLVAIAPTVFTAAPGAAWEDNLRGVGLPRPAAPRWRRYSVRSPSGLGRSEPSMTRLTSRRRLSN
ncbi:periplasmic binding family protein [Mycobacterium kansasii 732]|nr:periplasmic binding family protein [Mycobacterium kansasii 732]